nr:helix-turn-helix domain-containing protein [Streptomyces sp. AMCC400023]
MSSWSTCSTGPGTASTAPSSRSAHRPWAPCRPCSEPAATSTRRWTTCANDGRTRACTAPRTSGRSWCCGGSWAPSAPTPTCAPASWNACGAHDAEHATAYAATLLAYLRHFGDVVAASGELHIHQNTLRLRLRRAEQLFGVSLADPTRRLLLTLELAALTQP